MKKILFTLILSIFLIPCLSFASTIGVEISGTSVNFTEASGIPFIQEGHTLVPMRIVMEKYGCDVTWNQNIKEATIIKDNVDVRVIIGASYVSVNGVKKSIEAPAQIVGGKTYLPIRAVLEAFGANVTWDNKNRSVIVKDNTDMKTDNLGGQNLDYEEFLNQFDIEEEFVEYTHQTILVYKEEIKRDDLRTQLQSMENLDALLLPISQKYYNKDYKDNTVVIRTNKGKSYTVLLFYTDFRTQTKISHQWLFKPYTEE